MFGVENNGTIIIFCGWVKICSNENVKFVSFIKIAKIDDLTVYINRVTM